MGGNRRVFVFTSDVAKDAEVLQSDQHIGLLLPRVCLGQFLLCRAGISENILSYLGGFFSDHYISRPYY